MPTAPIKTPTGGFTDTASNHSWGLAIDINAPENPFGGVSHAIPEEMGNFWESWGFRWGGHYETSQDWMHFEFMGTPEDALTLTEKARGEFDMLTEDQLRTLDWAEGMRMFFRGEEEPARGEHREAWVERCPAGRLGVQGRQVSSPAKTAGYEKDEEDRVKGLLVLFIAFGLILIVGTLAFRADGGATRAALLLLALAMFLMTMVGFGWVNRYLSGVARGTTLGILALVVALIALLPVLYLGEDERIYFLKLAAIVFLSLLPGLLYLQIVVVKGLGLRSEYILALHRLHIDRYENLPTPPVGSLFHRPGPHPHGGDVENFYIRKFDSYYGRPITRPDGMVVQAGGNLLPVLIATIVIATGWTLVLQPEFIPGIHLELGGLQLAGTPVLPSEALRYAFLGAYFYSLEMLTRRYFQEDLKPSAYLNAVTRILGSALLVIAVNALWPGELTSAQENGLAFVVGVFPQIGMKAIQNLIGASARGR